MYYLYSALSGSFEIGLVLWAVTNQMSPCMIIALGMAYQLGNLIPTPFCPSKNVFKGAFILCIFLSTCIVFGEMHVGLLFMNVVLISGILQGIREACYCDNIRWKKRLCRVAGFASAFLYKDYFHICISVIVFVLALGLRFLSDKRTKVILGRGNRTMILHQMHYFCYAYYMLYISYALSESMLVTVGSFVLSWLTYLLVEPFLQRFGNRKWKMYLCVGHIGLGLLLFSIFILVCKESLSYLVLWWLSGFGGGTVFCIRLVEESKCDEKISQETWRWSENIGHVMGCLLGILWISLTGIEEGIIILSGILALITVWSACKRR